LNVSGNVKFFVSSTSTSTPATNDPQGASCRRASHFP
jgi:hypothetical protein